jgi:cytochrome c5
MSRIAMFLFVALFSLTLVSALTAQQTQTPQKATPPSYAAIPAEDAKQTNPVKSSPESLACARKWWGLDCAMCHGKDGDGKGNLAADMKLKIGDFRILTR